MTARFLIVLTTVLVAFFATAHLYTVPLLLTFVIVAQVFVFILMQPKKALNLNLFLVGGILGVTFESYGISKGAWSYSVPFVFGLPIWLFPLWGLATLVIAEIKTLLIELGDYFGK